MSSPNFNERKNGVQPDMLILHYTGMESAQAALQRLCDPQSEVSAHYVVDEDGSIIQLVEEDKRAWHAGVSYWDGITDINSHSIGIEIVNPGHEFGYCDFPEAQINAVTALCKSIIDSHNIMPHRVLAHSDAAPARKQDPGERFPWQRLAAQGIGLWPEPSYMDIDSAPDILLVPEMLQELLHAYGYDPHSSFQDILRAFHRHFYPEKFESGADPGVADEQTAARLLALVRAKHETSSVSS